jgi:hypothetical protein
MPRLVAPALTAAAAAFLVAVTGALPASAAPPPQAPPYVVIQPGDGIVQGDRTFYEVAGGSSSTFAIFAREDGSLPYGVTTGALDRMIRAGVSARDGFERLAARSTSGTDVQRTQALASDDVIRIARTSPNDAYGTIGTTWSRAWRSTIYVMGRTRDTRVWYSCNVAPNTSQVNVGQGLGYYWGFNSTTRTYGYFSSWYDLGSASPRFPGGTSVPWGQVSAYPQFRARCASTVGCAGYWWH